MYKRQALGKGAIVRSAVALASANLFPALAVIWQMDRWRTGKFSSNMPLAKIMVEMCIRDSDRPVNDYFLAQGGTKDAKTFPEILTAEDYGIAISKKNPELAKQIDEALEKLQANGEYDKIFEKWFGKQVK